MVRRRITAMYRCPGSHGCCAGNGGSTASAGMRATGTAGLYAITRRAARPSTTT
ncbi:hypothetical protein QJS66_17085 [Kocuria rhizophila]|nr:hypothetical protein QJS66_17085 [Kocuria rhizophila]